MDSKPFLPSSKPSVLRLVREAVRRNEERDEQDRASGFAAPGDYGLAPLLRTAISAIVSGMETQTWPEIAEGLVMLMEAELTLRCAEGKS